MPQLFLKIAILVGLLLMPRPAHAEGLFLINLGYLQGTFTPNKAFPISGPILGMEGGYQTQLGKMFFSGGILTRYSELKYQSNGVSKSTRWYYTGAYASASTLLTPTFEVKLKGGYAPYSKIFVSASNKLKVNDSEEEVREYSMYQGGNGMEFTASFINRWPGKKKYAVIPFGGVEIGSISQTLTKKNQKTVIEKGGEEPFETKDSSTGSYKISAMMLSFMLGVNF